MTREGPPLETLLRRLSETPPEFLAAAPFAAALAADLARDLDQRPTTTTNPLATLGVWLLREPSLMPSAKVAALAKLSPMAGVATPAQVVDEADVREEFARRVLSLLGLRPAGETEGQAADRLAALDSVERLRVTRQTAAAEARTRAVRKAMAKKAAEAAAQRYSPE